MCTLESIEHDSELGPGYVEADEDSPHHLDRGVAFGSLNIAEVIGRDASPCGSLLNCVGPCLTQLA